jgi:hypothetical protein
MVKKKILQFTNLLRDIELFIQKIAIKLKSSQKYGLGSEIRDPERTNSYPGTRGQQGTGSWIRIRNTAQKYLKIQF